MELTTLNNNQLKAWSEKKRRVASLFGDLVCYLTESNSFIISTESVPDTKTNWFGFQLESGSIIGVGICQTAEALNQKVWRQLIRLGHLVQEGEGSAIAKIMPFDCASLTDKPREHHSVKTRSSTGEWNHCVVSAPGEESSVISLGDTARNYATGRLNHQFLLTTALIPMSSHNSIGGPFSSLSSDIETVFNMNDFILTISASFLKREWIFTPLEKGKIFKLVEERMMDLNDYISFKLVLGTLSLSLQDILDISPGTELELEFSPHSKAYLDIDGDTWAEGTVRWQDDMLIFKIGQIKGEQDTEKLSPMIDE